MAVVWRRHTLHERAATSTTRTDLWVKCVVTVAAVVPVVKSRQPVIRVYWGILGDLIALQQSC